MRQQGISQVELAQKSGVSQPVISRTIYNNSSVLNTNQLEAIALALGKGPSEILRQAETTILARHASSKNQ